MSLEARGRNLPRWPVSPGRLHQRGAFHSSRGDPHQAKEVESGDSSHRVGGKHKGWVTAPHPQLRTFQLEKPISLQQYPDFWRGISITEGREETMEGNLRISHGINCSCPAVLQYFRKKSAHAPVGEPHPRKPLQTVGTPRTPRAKPYLLVLCARLPGTSARVSPSRHGGSSGQGRKYRRAVAPPSEKQKKGF